LEVTASRRSLLRTTDRFPCHENLQFSVQFKKLHGAYLMHTSCCEYSFALGNIYLSNKVLHFTFLVFLEHVTFIFIVVIYKNILHNGVSLKQFLSHDFSPQCYRILFKKVNERLIKFESCNSICSWLLQGTAALLRRNRRGQ